MMRIFASVAIAGLYSLLILRWSHDFQTIVAPWFRMLLLRIVGKTSSRLRIGSAQPSRDPGSKIAAAMVLLGLGAMLLPVLLLGTVLYLRSIPISLALPWLAVSLFTTWIAWRRPVDSEPRR
jgi:hypothetical protein